MRIAQISGSIAALLAATGAYALAPTTATYDISLVVSGSSAFEPNFKAEFANICISDMSFIWTWVHCYTLGAKFFAI